MLKKAICIKPDKASYYIIRGEVKRSLDDLTGALADFDQAVTLKPDASNYSYRGMMKLNAGDLEGALNDCEKAIALKPNSNTVKGRLNAAKKAIRDRDRLQAEYDQAMSLAPDSAENCNKRGMAKWTKKDLDGALIEYDRAIGLNPDFGEAYGGRGQLKWLKDLAGALADLNKALELIPGDYHLREIRSFVKKDLKHLKGETAVKTKTFAKKIPKTENTLALRTDFSDEAGWQKLCEAIQNPENSSDDFTANVDFVSDRAFEGLTSKQLPASLSDDSQSFAFIVDKTALSSSERPILVVDLQDEPGQSFRVIASELWSVENNLSIANMGFEEFAGAVDQDGIFRGFK